MTGITVYPVKGCAGIATTRAVVTPRGFAGDRLFMIVDGNGRFVTQRECAGLARVRPSPRDGVLGLTAPGHGEIDVPIRISGPACDVVVWRDTCRAIDQGQEAADWISGVAGAPCRLVRMDDAFVRPVSRAHAAHESDQVGFADGYPFLVISEESLAELNRRIGMALPMNRFRPNIVTAGGEPFNEDRVRRFRIGTVVFEAVKPCARCVVTTVDQGRGERDGVEPLRTLATFRRAPGGGVWFGHNLVHDGGGEVAVGDVLEVLATQAAPL